MGSLKPNDGLRVFRFAVCRDLCDDARRVGAGRRDGGPAILLSPAVAESSPQTGALQVLKDRRFTAASQHRPARQTASLSSLSKSKRKSS